MKRKIAFLLGLFMLASSTIAYADSSETTLVEVSSAEQLLGGEKISEGDKENFEPLPEDERLEVLDMSKDMAEDKAFTMLGSELYEYYAYKCPTDPSYGYDEYQIVFYSLDDTLYAIMEVIDFQVSAGYTIDYITSIRPSDIYPGFNDMPFATAEIYGGDEIIRYLIVFEGFDDPKNVDIAYNYGLIQLAGYSSNATISADSYIRWLESSGYKKLTDYEMSQANLLV